MMMLLDTETVIKRVLTVAAITIVSAAVVTVWYLKRENDKISIENTELKSVFSTTSVELNNSIKENLEETKKVNAEIKQQQVVIKKLQQEISKLKETN